MSADVDVDGAVKVAAHTAGSVTAFIQSDAIGVALNSVTDASTASVKGSALMSGLTVESQSSDDVSATGIASDNIVGGDTTAIVENSDVAIGSDGLTLQASDGAVITAQRWVLRRQTALPVWLAPLNLRPPMHVTM